ncbi:hypothetical protein LNV47_19200 [Paucibacter sp. DJ4R-1]|nr:hypothetical protein [Paucibacter sp. DJ4R-1]
MTFKLRIPGRDENKRPQPANPANPLIMSGPISGLAGLAAIPAANENPSNLPISRLAGLAAPADGESDLEAMRHRSAAISHDGEPYWRADELAGLPLWSDAEIRSFEQRQARFTWMGYGHIAEQLAETMLHRDRDLDDRRLCVECAHGGPDWRCKKLGEAFFLEQLQRCPSFRETTT